MSSKAHADRLAKAIRMSGLAEPVNVAYAANRVNVLCRVPQGSDSKWVDLIRRLLLATDAEQGEAHAWQAHICRHYFLKEVKEEKRLVFGWNISIQSQNMSASLDAVMPIFRGEVRRAKPVAQVEEMSLTGVTAERNVPTRPGQRGAFTVGGKHDFKPTGAGR